MLSESSYLTALAVYCGAAGLALLYLAWWLGQHWRAGWVALVVLMGAALLLTPAYPQEGVSTLAPALIVAGFQLATQGPEAAEHALRPLAFMSALALGLSSLFALLLLLLRGRRAGAPAPGSEEQ